MAASAGQWLDESRVMESSTVYVRAYIYFYSENGYSVPDSLSSYYDKSTNRFEIKKEYITDAEFEGVCIGARKGKITIKDPFGDWLKIFVLTGGQRNDDTYKGFCNFEIVWGWDGLRNSKPYVDGDFQRLIGIIYTTSYDTDNVSGDTVTISFMESGDDFLGTLVFDDPADTLLLNDDLEANKNINGKKLNDCTVSEVLTYIWTHSQSIKRALGSDPSIISVTFQDTFDKGKSGKYATNKIRFGDRVVDKINELIALAEPDDKRKNAQKDATKEGRSLSYSYEILTSSSTQTSKDKKLIVKKNIVYGWRDYTQDAGQSTGDMDLFKNAVKGPILFLKKYPNSGNTSDLLTQIGENTSSNSYKLYKYPIELKIDLKNFDYVSALGKGKIDSILTKYSQEDFAIIQDTIEQLAKKNNGGNIDFSQFKSWGNPSMFDVSKDKTSSGGIWGAFATHESDESVQKRKRLYEDFFNEVTDKDSPYTNPSVNAQIRGIVANNVFNATVTILGDPSLGTTYIPNEIFFYIDTSNLSGATSDMDFLRWMMKKVTHHLQEGKFTSSLELYSLPPDKLIFQSTKKPLE